MTKKEAIESIKNATKAIALFFTNEETKVEEFVADKVKDSSALVEVDGDVAVGSKVTVSSSTGSIPAPDDTYELADGSKFKTKGGEISEVIAEAETSDEDFSEAEKVEEKPEEAEVEKVEEVTVDEKAVEIEALKAKITELESEFSKIKEAFATKEDLKTLGENFNKIESAFDVLADTPAEFSKVDKSIELKEDKENKLKALASIFNNK